MGGCLLMRARILRGCMGSLLKSYWSRVSAKGEAFRGPYITRRYPLIGGFVQPVYKLPSSLIFSEASLELGFMRGVCTLAHVFFVSHLGLRSLSPIWMLGGLTKWANSAGYGAWYRPIWGYQDFVRQLSIQVKPLP